MLTTNIKIEGSGVYCCVYYIEPDVFEEIINVNIQNIPRSRFNLIEKRCSSKQLVSKGFFANSNKKITQVSLIDRYGKSLPLGYIDLDCATTLDNLTTINKTFDPKDHQICVVIYDEFKDGVSTIPIRIGKRFEPEKLLYILKPIGHSDEGNLWEMTTNQGLFVEDSYKDKEGNSVKHDFEFYVDGIEYDGKVFQLDNLTFNTAHSKLWVWKYDKEISSFGLDYLTSAKINWGFRGQAGPTIVHQ